MVRSGIEAVRLLHEDTSDLFSCQYTEPEQALHTVSLPRCSACSIIYLEKKEENGCLKCKCSLQAADC